VLAAGEIWKVGTIVPERLEAGGASTELVSTLYLVLAMGISMASNFAQNVADALMQRLLWLVGEAAAPLMEKLEREFPRYAAHAAARRRLDADAGGSQASPATLASLVLASNRTHTQFGIPPLAPASLRAGRACLARVL
jgi:hypothetical protein